MSALNHIGPLMVHEKPITIPVLVSDDVVEVSVDLYLQQLNNNRCFGEQVSKELSLLNNSLKILETEPLSARDLVDRFLSTILREVPKLKSCPRSKILVNNVILSNGKRKKVKYAKLEKLCKKSRRTAVVR